jgi:hypothetical protein
VSITQQKKIVLDRKLRVGSELPLVPIPSFSSVCNDMQANSNNFFLPDPEYLCLRAKKQVAIISVVSQTRE